MNRREKLELLFAVLAKELQVFARTKVVLETSFRKCAAISLVGELSEQELESFEALTSRFARLVDIASQKLFKTVFLILRETRGTIIDQAMLAERLKIIPSAETFLELRELRNLIAHEYVEESLMKLFQGILDQEVAVVALYTSIDAYCRNLQDNPPAL